jgi:hypothetical protein
VANDRGIATGIFYDRACAEEAVARLRRLGYEPKSIHVLMSDATLAREFADATGIVAESESEHTTLRNAAIGGGLGLVIATVTAGGSLAVFGATGGLALPVIAAPLAVSLGTVGAISGAIGALLGAGVPPEKAGPYREALTRGGIVIAVPRHERIDEDVMRILASDAVTPTPPTYVV